MKHSLGRLQMVRIAVLLLVGCSLARAQDHWVGSWAAAPMASKSSSGKLAPDAATGTTLRQIVHLSLGGPSVRVELSNEFGLEALTITAGDIALSAGGGKVAEGSSVALTFSGHPSITIPAGAMVVSDPARLKVAAFADVAVSLFLPDQPVNQLSRHPAAYQTNYMAAGNLVTAAALTGAKPFYSWDFLKGVEVQVTADAAAIVTFGDSITDGAHSTRDANARWPDVLARRLAADPRTARLGVLNEGIGGNRILHDNTGPNALARFDRDVLAQAGVKYLVVLESINDIGHAADPLKPYDVVSADDLIAGLAQMARRAHTHGIKVFGATITPYLGAGYASPAGEIMRQAVNHWIRTTGDLDGVIDFDKATADPSKPDLFLPADDSGDHLHPGDAGYRAMAGAIDLTLFTK